MRTLTVERRTYPGSGKGEVMKKYVWVLEIGIFHATLPKISKWEIWDAFPTRAEAVDFKNKSSTHVNWRIVKYVPEEKP